MEGIIQDLKAGKHLCLVSDAGTPGISDPGALLVKRCIEENIPVTAMPGPCAAIQALICSGLPTEQFQFWGFLARKDQELKQEIQTILVYPGTTICYESPHRLLHVLDVLHAIKPERQLVVARELTKKFEEFFRGTAANQMDHWQKNPLKGEIVLLISPAEKSEAIDWSDWSPEEHVQWLQTHYHIDRKEAIKLAAELRGVPKRQIYQSVQRK